MSQAVHRPSRAPNTAESGRTQQISLPSLELQLQGFPDVRGTGREITQIYEGTNQIQRVVMSRQILR